MSSSPDRRPLEGMRVVVTREKPGELDEALIERGAEIVSVPAIATVDADDGGETLLNAAERLAAGAYDWLVLTSAKAAARLIDTGHAVPEATRIAAIGTATATAMGGEVDLIPPEAVGESLVEAFPTGRGRVLALRPEVAREVVAAGLRDKGWDVDEVAAYRTVAPPIPADMRDAVGNADIVTFTSPSTVNNLVAAVGVAGLPDIVVSIGPVTSRALAAHGLVVNGEASPHTAGGLVDAVVASAPA